MKKINPIISWWMTPKLPYHDVYELPLLKNKSLPSVFSHIISRWFIHPIKRRLARIYLKLLQRFTKIKVIAITGSAGKSTTTQMIDSVLKLKGRSLSTPPSIDPVYNIPNTILKCKPGVEFLVLEMSVEYLGEMDYYLWLAKPEIGVITNIFPAHTQFLGGIEGVLKEKGKLVLSLPKDGTAILNNKDSLLANLAKRLRAEVVWFDGSGDLIAQNLSAATKVAETLGVDSEVIKKGLANYKNPEHRLQVLRSKSGAMILDDTYNSNPKAAIATLSYFNKMAKGNKIAVLGDMRELGDYEVEGHRSLGREVAKSGFKVVIGVGKSSKFMIEEVKKGSKDTETYLVANSEEVLPILTKLLVKNNSILIKGSRSIGLDRVVNSII